MTQRPDGIRLRVTILGAIVMALFSALLLRLYSLQVLTHERYAQAAERNRIRIVPVEAARGQILDRNGEVLIGNRLSYVVSIRPDELDDRAGVISRLAELLAVPVSQIEERLADKTVLPYTPIPIFEDVPEDTQTFIREHQDRYRGVVTESRPIRTYGKGMLAAHALGYVGEINPEQLVEARYRGFRPGSIIGRSGIEYAYERDLHGQDGLVKLVVDSTGKVRDQLGGREPERGLDLTTTLDSGIQALAEESLRLGIESARTIFDKERQKKYLAPAGGVVVMDPRNGEILAMASYPTFDPSAFVGGIPKAEFQALATDPANPLLNRATQSVSPPGSTFKIVTAAAALQDGIAQRNGKYNCPGSFRFADTTFRNWKTSDSGSMSIPQAIIDSCDTVFYGWGAEFYRKFRAKGGERLQDYARDFGFGVKSGIEIPFESAGRVPDEGWLKRVNLKHPDLFPYSTWLPGYTINMSIGQGDVLATPLQLVNSYATIANGGTLYQPHLGLKLSRDGAAVRSVSAKVIRQLTVNPANMDTVRRGLEGVATVGTARGAFDGYPFGSVAIASKTGTAEIKTVPPKQPYAWFAAYAPAKSPQYVIAVMLEEGGHGGETAAPIARRIIEGIFGLPLSQITPSVRTD